MASIKRTALDLIDRNRLAAMAKAIGLSLHGGTGAAQLRDALEIAGITLRDVLGELKHAEATTLCSQLGLDSRARAKATLIRRILDAEDRPRLQRLGIVSMFTDDELRGRFALKGGNALDLVFGLSDRASLDLDFSMSSAFAREELPDVRTKLARALESAHLPAGYRVFDVQLEEKPESLTPNLEGFWGGYKLRYKVIEAERYAAHAGDVEALRRNATEVGPRGSRTAEIDISRFEYCGAAMAWEFEGHRILVYTPKMLVAEKLRAICQQTPDYTAFVRSHRRKRARDFLDIHALVTKGGARLTGPDDLELVRLVFAAKRVSLAFLPRIGESRHWHSEDWPSVVDTVRGKTNIGGFDFYFDFVRDMVDDELKALWVE